MSSQAENLNDEEFFYSYLPEHLDGELSGADKERFDKLLAEDAYAQVPIEFGIKKGQFQIGLQKLFVDESLTHDLHVLVENDAERANHESEDIEDYGHTEIWGSLLRGATLLAFVVAILGAAYYYLGPEREPPFNALESLTYESLVMIEDPEDRLDLPTGDMDELRSYFSRYPDLGFEPKAIKAPGLGWQLVGASVFDYEVQKIAVSQFAKGEAKLFLYQFEGSLSDFPKAPPANHKGILYMTYTSEYFNILVWQVDEETVAMMVGQDDASSLAELAFNTLGS